MGGNGGRRRRGRRKRRGVSDLVFSFSCILVVCLSLFEACEVYIPMFVTVEPI